MFMILIEGLFYMQTSSNSYTSNSMIVIVKPV